MKNKKLESLLKENEHEELIKIIEKCEKGKVAELKMSHNEVITKNSSLDKKVIKYLGELNVNLIVVPEKELFKSTNRYYKAKAVCKNGIHAILDMEMDSKDKIVEVQKTHQTIKIDKKSYVTCIDCWDILPILGYKDGRKESKNG